MTKAIPDGMHTVTPHLVCQGAAAAIDFYKRAFNATELSRLPGPNGRLMHAMIRIGDSTVMLIDEMPECGGLSPISLKRTPVAIHLYVEDADALAAQALRAGVKTVLPVRYVLGRSLWRVRRSIRPSLVDCHPCAGRDAGRHAQGDAAANVHRPAIRAAEPARSHRACLIDTAPRSPGKPGGDEDKTARGRREPSAPRDDIGTGADHMSEHVNTLERAQTHGPLDLQVGAAPTRPRSQVGQQWTRRAGWGISGLMVVFLLFDSIAKLALEQHVVEATTMIGYPAAVIRPLGLICLVCTILYAVPRTSILGAILLTGYLGGAIASKVRIEDPLFTSVLFGVYFGILIWGGLYLRDERLRSLIPLRRP
jgi:uncharacterized glyoxalase superfamily protein PhnB